MSATIEAVVHSAVREAFALAAPEQIRGAVHDYEVLTDPMDDLQCDSCQ